MRVLHVTPSYSPATGGIEEFVRALCAYSRRTGIIEPEICVCNDGYPGVPAMEVIEGTRVRRLLCRGRGPLRWVPDVSALKESFDVIHLHDPHVGALTARFAFAAPRRAIVLSTHGGFFHTGRFPVLKRLHFAATAPALLSRVNAVIASSEQDSAVFGRVSSRVRCIRNGVDFDRFHASRAARIAPQGDCVYFGRLASNKRLDRLIDAFAALDGLCAEPPLLRMVGEDFTSGALDALRARAQQRGIANRVVFHGRLSDEELLRVVALSRFFVSASEYEGFGLSAVEAMAAGLIPLLSDIGPFRTLVRDGINGALIDYRIASGAAHRIASVLSLPAARLEDMRRHAMDTARTYSWTARVYSFLDVYRQVLAEAERNAPRRPQGIA